MQYDRGTILVPTDFSAIADNAVRYACMIADATEGNIVLVHIADTGKKEQEEKLRNHSAKLDTMYGRKITPLLYAGNIFTGIAVAAVQTGASLIVMGTHGVRGLQHIRGAHALKVAVNSPVPILIVQERPPIENTIRCIVSPVNAAPESKQKTTHTLELARRFGAEVHLYKIPANSEAERNTTQLNTQYMSRYLVEHGVKVSITEGREDKGRFVQSLLQYTIDVAADLMIILTTYDKTLRELMLGAYEQELINNPGGVPVLCINPLQNRFRNITL